MKWAIAKLDIPHEYIEKPKFLRWNEGDIILLKELDEDNYILCDVEMLLNKQIMYATGDDMFNYFSTVNENIEDDYLPDIVCKLLDVLIENASVIE